MDQVPNWKFCAMLVVIFLIGLVSVPQSRADTLNDLHKKAVKEGVVSFYGTLAQVNAEKILPVFEKRFPGVKVNQLDITSDQLVTRAVTEARADGQHVSLKFFIPKAARKIRSRGKSFTINFSASQLAF